jgi:hypothetical protein
MELDARRAVLHPVLLSRVADVRGWRGVVRWH